MGMKSVFDGLYVDQLIQKNERGELIVYPNGMMGRGYLLPAEREAAVRLRMRMLMLFSLVIGISFALFVQRVMDSGQVVSLIGWTTLGGIGALLMGAIMYFQSQLKAGLEPVPGPRPSAGEWFRRGRQARATWTYWVSAALGASTLLLGIAGVAMAISGDLSAVAGAGFLLLVGALLTWDGVLGLIERYRA